MNKVLWHDDLLPKPRHDDLLQNTLVAERLGQDIGDLDAIEWGHMRTIVLRNARAHKAWTLALCITKPRP